MFLCVAWAMGGRRPAGPGGSSASSSAPGAGPAPASPARSTSASRPTPQAIAKTRETLQKARQGDPVAKAAVNAAVVQSLKDRGIVIDAATPASKAQQAALKTGGQALPEFQFPTGPVPLPPPGGASNDNAQQPEPKQVKPFSRTPGQAAGDLKTFLEQTGRFGSKADRPKEVQEAQRDMGVDPDGIVGPNTRKRAELLNVKLPAAPAVAKSAARKVATKTKRA